MIALLLFHGFLKRFVCLELVPKTPYSWKNIKDYAKCSTLQTLVSLYSDTCNVY